MELIKLINVSKHYLIDENKVSILNNINLSIEENQFVVILGPSGAGKTTLLNIIGSLDNDFEGEIYVQDTLINNFNEKQLNSFRKNTISFIFQSYNLITTLTVKENLQLVNKDFSDEQIVQIMKDTNIERLANKFPNQLSGGEQQRVAVARSLVKPSKLLLCDEPTGALDISNSVNVVKLIYDNCKIQNKTAIVVTHNEKIAEIADIVIYIKNGEIEKFVKNNKPLSIGEVDW